jgi:hypothetical protein
LPSADRRSHLRRRIEPVADPERFRASHELFEKRLVELLVHDDTARRGAALAARAKATPQAPLHRQLEVRIVHDHDDVLAAHLEVHLLERRRRLRRYGAADLGGSGE